MNKMQHLSAIDAAFLHLETAEMPMHVGSLHRCRLPDGYDGNWHDDVKAHMAKRLHLAPVFTRKLALMPFDLANPVWIEADDIDLDYHVRHTVLPRPGTQEQLEALAARLHSSLLDRSRPLWEIYVIDGLADGTMGYYIKVHHAAIDGQAGVALGNAMLDVTPVPRKVKAPRHRRPHAYQLGVAELLGAALSNTWYQLRMVGRLVMPLGKALAGSVRKSWAERADPSGRSLFALAPPTPFNVTITNQRVFATASLPLAEAKALGKAHGASVNDTVLWLCSTALRGYLKDSRELPAASLVAGVPVSLRDEGDTRMNNQVTMTFVELGSQIADPLERLAAIKAATASMKSTMGVFGELIPTDFPSIGAPWLLSGLVSLYGRTRLADRIRVANVTISNVPGAQVPLYMAGAQMLDYCPVSIVIHGVALNITVQSYMGQLCFGLIACRRAVPDVRDIADGITRAFDAMRRLAPALPAEAAPAPLPAPAAKAPRKARPKLEVVGKAPARRRRAARTPKAAA